jgi:hypothetical protein
LGYQPCRGDPLIVNSIMRIPILVLACAPVVALAQSSNATWSVSPQPLLRIGDESSPTAIFKGASAVRTEMQEIVVLDDASGELRLFSSKGTFVKLLARRGSGPGELEGPASISTDGDSIFVIENNRRLLQVFAPRVGFVRQQRASASNVPGVLLISRLGTGRFLVSVTVRPSVNGFTALDPKIRPGDHFGDSVTLGVLSKLDSGVVRTFGSFANANMFAYSLPALTGPNAALSGRLSVTRVPLAPTLVRAATGSRIWVGNTGSPTIEIFGAEGVPYRTVTLPVNARPLDRSAVERVRARLAQNTNGDLPKARLEAQFSAEALPAVAPFYRTFFPGTDGAMWVQLFNEDPDVQQRYFVYSVNGQLLAQVYLPARFTPTHVGASWVLGIQRDDDDVETVVMLHMRLGS